ncbi:hypothetical protein H696_04547 [Fonticula alba]|uniref:Ras-GAP domain-containing protein n=1 Tax=Fonticula alba TaxID=691883 RepID=A0A058Z6H6_FONAL|nr:hypothetical protein H696_04547 [Fonticula alba]KCV69132.1 hypothetical protein H696_04547 [Fonticula alba]|eukprot:XP_009496703.1 hypothetical protein H696_04547 [Fonticula alba]
MSFAQSLTNRFDVVSNHTADTLEFTKEVVAFFKRRLAIEEEYSKSMYKLSQTVGDVRKRFPSLAKSDLFDTFLYSMTQMAEVTDSHKKMCTRMSNFVVDPFTPFIRELDSMRKSLVNQGKKYNSFLQEAFSDLKRAQDAHDKLSRELEALDGQSLPPGTTAGSGTGGSGTDGPDGQAHFSSTGGGSWIDVIRRDNPSKIATKTQQLREKLRLSESTLELAKRTCDERQTSHYEDLMPGLLERFEGWERNRIEFTLMKMQAALRIEHELLPTLMTYQANMDSALRAYSEDEEIASFVAEHASSDNTLRTSVASLTQSLRQGRLQYLTPGGWRSVYFVLMASTQLAYIFESESSSRPKFTFHLFNACVRPIHESAYGRRNVFCIDWPASPNVALARVQDDNDMESGSTESLANSGSASPLTRGSAQKGRSLFFASEDIIDAFNWIHCLKSVAKNIDSVNFHLFPRLCDRLLVRLTEARGLPIASDLSSSLLRSSNLNYHCVLSFDDSTLPEAITQSVSGYSPGAESGRPLWNEAFSLEDIPHFRSVTVRVFASGLTSLSSLTSRAQDVCIGQVIIPRAVIMAVSGVQENADGVPTSQIDPAEFWFPLTGSPEHGIQSGLIGSAVNSLAELQGGQTAGFAVRLRFELQPEIVMPVNMSFKFDRAIASPSSYFPIRALLEENGIDRDRFTRLIVRHWTVRGVANERIQYINDYEIATSENTSTLFRSNTIASKMTEQYLRLLSTGYVASVLGPVIRSIQSTRLSYEVDNSRVDDIEELRKNARRLVTACKNLLDLASTNLDQFPADLSYILSRIRSSVMSRFPNDAKAHYTCVGGFVFLRLLCPALLSPRSFGLVTEQPDDRATRALMLIAKVVQNVANLVPDKSLKDLSSVPEVASFINESHDVMRSFLVRISSVSDGFLHQPKSETLTAGSPEFYTQIQSYSNIITAYDPNRELSSICYVFNQFKHSIESNPAHQNDVNIVETYLELTALNRYCRVTRSELERSLSSERQTGLQLNSTPTSPLPSPLPNADTPTGDGQRRSASQREVDTQDLPGSPLATPISSKSSPLLRRKSFSLRPNASAASSMQGPTTTPPRQPPASPSPRPAIPSPMPNAGGRLTSLPPPPPPLASLATGGPAAGSGMSSGTAVPFSAPPPGVYSATSSGYGAAPPSAPPRLSPAISASQLPLPPKPYAMPGGAAAAAATTQPRPETGAAASQLAGHPPPPGSLTPGHVSAGAASHDNATTPSPVDTMGGHPDDEPRPKHRLRLSFPSISLGIRSSSSSYSLSADAAGGSGASGASSSQPSSGSGSPAPAMMSGTPSGSPPPPTTGGWASPRPGPTAGGVPSNLMRELSGRLSAHRESLPPSP